ncbi:hypothetical protein TanjilG_13057 [Lupinus angustifolius]|uniref:PLAC8 family protein n=2 Tax=Lupinus angustifolius TaxID=3871 RepID=A0A1J7G6I4_LUPAN|nr:PREDICTED: uncharacterized protein LOC109329747 isoform X1 [Lupinus angustifolius]OIV96125.1 hypothetical protein TanjilG_13057 [Lupinus angustifolius]
MVDLEKQERVVVAVEEDGGGDGEEERLLDFNMLCSSVAMQTAHGTWGKKKLGVEDEEEEEQGEGGGVLRLWEGELFDCFDDRTIAFQSACCPCYRFGKNMKRAGFGSCYVQTVAYFLLAMGAFLNFIAFTITRRHHYLYLAIAFIITVGAYLGFFRTRMRRKFNIKGRDSSLDDCAHHFVCPCCSLCQESRTLEMNNVQGGTWHGRGDTICIGGVSDGSKALFELSPPHVVAINYSDESCMEKKSIDVSNQS